MTLAAALAAVPFCLALSARWLARWTVRRLSPAAGTVLLTCFALVVALCCGLVLCLVGYLGTVDLLPGWHPDDWSVRQLRSSVPVPTALAVAAGIAGLLLLANAVRRLLVAVLAGRRIARSLRPLPRSGLVSVLDDDRTVAFSVPAGLLPRRPGRIVVSTAVLRALAADERRALLAHERSHLAHRHSRYRFAARLASAANPLLRPVAGAVDAMIERWADADAAAEVGDPGCVARAVGTVALGGRSTPAGALAAADADVVARVRDLLAQRPHRVAPGVALAVASVGCLLSGVVVTLHAHEVVELAEAVLARR